jgi:Protein of unknown function (DUF5131)
MTDDSKIERTHSTWSPIRGCTKVSLGCKNWYAEVLPERFRGANDQPFEWVEALLEQEVNPCLRAIPEEALRKEVRHPEGRGRVQSMENHLMTTRSGMGHPTRSPFLSSQHVNSKSFNQIICVFSIYEYVSTEDY